MRTQNEAVSRILASKCYYSILGVSKSCSTAKIRQTYRQLALTFHPDKNKGEGAVEAFQAIGNAYEVLSDKEQRQQYDRRIDDYGLGTDDWHSQDNWRGDGGSKNSEDEPSCDDDEGETRKGNYGRRQFYYTRRYGG